MTHQNANDVTFEKFAKDKKSLSIICHLMYNKSEHQMYKQLSTKSHASFYCNTYL